MLRQDHEKELAAIKDEDQREEKWREIQDEWEKETELPVKGFLDLTEFGFGEPIFEDQEEKAEAEKIICDKMFSLRDFPGGDESIISQLHPRLKKGSWRKA